MVVYIKEATRGLFLGYQYSQTKIDEKIASYDGEKKDFITAKTAQTILSTIIIYELKTLLSPCLNPFKLKLFCIANVVTNIAANIFIQTAENKTEEIKTLKVCVKYLNAFNHVAVVITGIALTIFGKPYFGVAIILTQTYDALNQYGLVPYRVNLFVTNCLPMISKILILISGSLILRTLIVYKLTTDFVKVEIYDKILQFVDTIFCSYFQSNRPTFKQIHAEIKTNRHASFDEINTLLNQLQDKQIINSKIYTINPAYCSKWTKEKFDLIENWNFNDYKSLSTFYPHAFESSNFFNHLKNDHKLICLLEDFFKNENVAELTIELTNYELSNQYQKILRASTPKKIITVYLQEFLEIKTQRANQPTVENFIDEWLNVQMDTMVKVLTKKEKIIGHLQDVEILTKNCAQILSYLKFLEEQFNCSQDIEIKKTIQSYIVQLGVGFTNYSAKKLKNLSYTLLNQLIHTIYIPASHCAIHPFEFKLKAKLETLRLETLKKTLEVKNLDFNKDLHIYYGCYPIEENLSDQLGIIELFKSHDKKLVSEKKVFYQIYKLHILQELKKLDFNEFKNYFFDFIQKNENLTNEQKKHFIDQYLSKNQGEWTFEQTQKIFQQLLLILLGIFTLHEPSK